MQEPADTELLQQYAEQNSEAAFAALVTRHVNLVYSTAVRTTGNRAAAEEITQAVFIILARKARTVRKETIISGWLYQTARLTAANYLRGEIRRVYREQKAYMQSLSNETDSSHPSAAERETWPQIEPLLDDAMGRLSKKERNAIVLRFFEGKSFQEIGMVFGGSENAAKKRVIHGLEKLRKFFTKHGVSSSTAIVAGAISANSIHAAPAALVKSATAVAVVKGAAASGSTLTLIQGTLKFMAWTQAKTAAVIGVCALTAGTTAVTVWKLENPIPAGWSVISGDSKSWTWAGGKINAHSTSGDSILASGKQYGDFTLSVIASTTNREASLAFHMPDADNGYILVFAPDGTPYPWDNGIGHIRLDKRTANSDTTVAYYHGPQFPAIGQPAKIEVTTRGPLIEVYLNDVDVMQVEDATFATGYIGLRIFGDQDYPCDATFSGVTFH